MSFSHIFQYVVQDQVFSECHVLFPNLFYNLFSGIYGVQLNIFLF
jgi:hypothetical protein